MHVKRKWIVWMSIFLSLYLVTLSLGVARRNGGAPVEAKRTTATHKIRNKIEPQFEKLLGRAISYTAAVEENKRAEQAKRAAALAAKQQAEQDAAQQVVAANVVPPTPYSPDSMGDAFWRRLANCENTRGDAPGGYFQFMGTTRTRVGWVPGLSYERQKQMAIWWAAQIHPNEGTRAGWPTCWWVALRD